MNITIHLQRIAATVQDISTAWLGYQDWPPCNTFPTRLQNTSGQDRLGQYGGSNGDNHFMAQIIYSSKQNTQSFCSTLLFQFLKRFQNLIFIDFIMKM